MMNSRHMVACLIGSCMGVSATQAGSDVLGIWIDHTGRGGVEVKECGSNLCGHLVWLKEGTDKRGCGLQIIGNARSVGKDLWDGGWILDPEDNKKYSVELKLLGSDRLRVVGYMGSKLFSETMTWKRAPSDLKRCDADQTPESETAKPPTPPEHKTDQPAPKRSGSGCTQYFAQIGRTVEVPCPKRP